MVTPRLNILASWLAVRRRVQARRPTEEMGGAGKTGGWEYPFQRYFVSQLTIVTRKKYKHMWLSRQRFFTRFFR
jgi:hypothetical protein